MVDFVVKKILIIDGKRLYTKEILYLPDSISGCTAKIYHTKTCPSGIANPGIKSRVMYVSLWIDFSHSTISNFLFTLNFFHEADLNGSRPQQGHKKPNEFAPNDCWRLLAVH